MKKHLIPLTLALAALTPLAAAQPAAPAPAEASAPAQTRADGLWIDVRTPQEHAQGSLPQSINIPLDQITSQIASVQADKNAPIHLYCRSGHRASIAKQALEEMGYTHVTNEGGYEALKAQSGQ
ncbi:MAG: rhodanese-like domain-containing protein [Ottowia sp.]